MRTYQSYLVELSLVILMAFCIGRALLHRIARGSEARRIHGQYVLWWSIGTFAVAAVIWPVAKEPDLPSGAGGFAGFGLLAGWLVGMIHGVVVVALRSKSEPEA